VSRAKDNMRCKKIHIYGGKRKKQIKERGREGEREEREAPANT